MTGTTGRSGGNRSTGPDNTPLDGGPLKPELPEAVSAKLDELLDQLLQNSDKHKSTGRGRFFNSQMWRNTRLGAPSRRVFGAQNLYAPG